MQALQRRAELRKQLRRSQGASICYETSESHRVGGCFAGSVPTWARDPPPAGRGIGTSQASREVERIGSACETVAGSQNALLTVSKFPWRKRT